MDVANNTMDTMAGDNVMGEEKSNLQNGDIKIKPSSGRITWKKLKMPVYRGKFIHSCVLALSLLALGVTIGLNGATFLDLQIITDTSLEKASGFFTSNTIGYLLGSLMTGVIMEKVNINLFLIILSFGLGGTTIAMPYCSIYEAMIAMKAVNGLVSGAIDTACNARHMKMWGSEGEGLMQFLHFCFAFGGILSPLYSEPFLAKETFVNESIPIEGEITTNMPGNLTSNHTLEKQWGETHVQYAYLITGTIVCLTAVPYFIFLCCHSEDTDESHADAAKPRELPKPLFILVVLLLCSFYVLYSCAEDTFASFLMTFLVNEYDSVTKSKGAFVTAVYWASFALSRFLMIFVAEFVSSFRLLCFCTCLMFFSYSGFLIVAYYGLVDGLIFFTVLIGFSMSAVFPSGLSWTDRELVKATEGVSAAVLVSASTGTMINPLLIGYLMEYISNMWFCYLLLIETAVMCLVFIILSSMFRCYLHKRYGLVNSPQLQLTLDDKEVGLALNSELQEQPETNPVS